MMLVDNLEYTSVITEKSGEKWRRNALVCKVIICREWKVTEKLRGLFKRERILHTHTCFILSISKNIPFAYKDRKNNFILNFRYLNFQINWRLKMRAILLKPLQAVEEASTGLRQLSYHNTIRLPQQTPKPNVVYG